MGGSRYYLLFFAVLLFETSCAKHAEVYPVPGSEKIKHYDAVDPAERMLFKLQKQFGCKMLIKEIVIPPIIKEGVFSKHIDEEIEIIAKNRAFNSGGNVVVLETFRIIPEIKLENKYTGKIIILKCP